MLFKCLIATLFTALAGRLFAAEATESKSAPIELHVATKEDLLALKTLLKREFYLQTIANQSQSEALSKLEIPFKALDESLERIQKQESTALSILRLMTGLLGLLLGLQILGMWLFKRGATEVTLDALAAKKPIDTDVPTSPIQSTENSIKAPLDEATAKVPPHSSLVPKKPVFISSIGIEKATPFFSNPPTERNTRDLQYTPPPVSPTGPFIEANKIKARALERVQKLHLSATL